MPCWTCQRSTIWAGVRPCRSAARRTGSSAKTVPSRPSGLHASVTMPSFSWWARTPSRVWYGLSWIWLTSGTTPVVSMIRSRWCGLKLETPTAFSVPSPIRSARVRKVST